MHDIYDTEEPQAGAAVLMLSLALQGREQDKQRHAGVRRKQAVQHHDCKGAEREAEGQWGGSLLSTPRCAIKLDVKYVPLLNCQSPESLHSVIQTKRQVYNQSWALQPVYSLAMTGCQVN